MIQSVIEDLNFTDDDDRQSQFQPNILGYICLSMLQLHFTFIT